MKATLSIIFLLFHIATYSQGFNLGQQFHRAQGVWKNEGNVPATEVKQWKAFVPSNYISFARMSGTMSNWWALDLPGYNYQQLTNQIAGQRGEWRGVPQPTQSYGYAFVNFVKMWGFDSIVWTLNTHRAFEAMENGNREEAAIWEKRMWAFLDLLDSNGINITHICLDNEWYLDRNICGLSAGSPNPGDRIDYFGIGGLFALAGRFEQPVKAKMNRYLDYLEKLTPELRKRYPNVKIVMSCDHTNTLRGRWMRDVVFARNFYDAIDLHFYPATKSTAESNRWVSDAMQPFRGRKVYVFEWNYHYDSGNPYNGFHSDMEKALKSNGVIHHLRHTLWYSGSAFSYIK